MEICALSADLKLVKVVLSKEPDMLHVCQHLAMREGSSVLGCIGTHCKNGRL